MSNFLITLVLAFVLVVLSVLGLGIAYFLTGKTKFSCKRCGKPESNCDICKKKKK